MLLALGVVLLIGLNGFSVLAWAVMLMESGKFLSRYVVFWGVVWFLSILGVFCMGLYIGGTGC